MRNGISGTSIPAGLPNADSVSAACACGGDFYPCLAYAIKWNETADLADAATVISADGGHGLFQLTSSWPSDWEDPLANATYAVQHFLIPAEQYWVRDFQGEDLVRAIAAEFNAGRDAVIRGHAEGDLDKYTTDNYAARALANYTKLIAGSKP